MSSYGCLLSGQVICLYSQQGLLFPYPKHSLKLYSHFHFYLSFTFAWVFSSAYKTKVRYSVAPPLWSLVKTLVIYPFFSWAEWYPEDSLARLHQTLPPWRQRKA